MDTCPTVKVKADNEQGFVVMNESDFDAEKHELFDKPATSAASNTNTSAGKTETKAEKKAREKAEAEAAAAAQSTGTTAPWKS